MCPRPSRRVHQRHLPNRYLDRDPALCPEYQYRRPHRRRRQFGGGAIRPARHLRDGQRRQPRRVHPRRRYDLGQRDGGDGGDHHQPESVGGTWYWLAVTVSGTTRQSLPRGAERSRARHEHAVRRQSRQFCRRSRVHLRGAARSVWDAALAVGACAARRRAGGVKEHRAMNDVPDPLALQCCHKRLRRLPRRGGEALRVCRRAGPCWPRSGSDWCIAFLFARRARHRDAATRDGTRCSWDRVGAVSPWVYTVVGRRSSMVLRPGRCRSAVVSGVGRRRGDAARWQPCGVGDCARDATTRAR